VHTAFDPESLRWYRGVYEGRPNNKSYADLSDLDFLFQMGLLVERTNTRLPTRAAVLLFGTDGVVRQLLPRPVVDCQRFGLPFEQAATGARWMDRIVVEENLIRTWRRLLDWYQKLAEQPFRVDSTTLQRDDMPADYIAFREATVNLLSHQDYADHTRKAEMRTYPDQMVFWNPGDAFATVADLLEPGEKEVRNPRIVSAFRRIGLSEHAGWGLRDVFRNWQQLGHIPPRITNDKARKAFALTLLKEELLSEEQLLFHAQLGVHLSEQEARVFAYACRVGELSMAEVKVLTSLGTSEAQLVVDRLHLQVLLQPLDGGQRYALAEHLRERFQAGRTDLVSDQVRREGQNLSTAQVGVQESNLSTVQVPLLRELSDTQWHLVDMCEIPRRLADIMTALGVSNCGFFKQHLLDPLIQAGVICMTNPDKPRSSNQKYILTETGAQIRARRLKERNGE
jgi:ATP-dependent DNA helicase RecG